MTMMHHTFISLGTNLGDRKENLHKARTLLQGETGQITAESSVYETEPWGFKHDQFFFNQVVSVQTNLNAFMLLKKLKGIETVMGRNNKLDEYSARIIDIDILFYDDMVIATDTLQLPHPLIEQRLFDIGGGDIEAGNQYVINRVNIFKDNKLFLNQ